MSKSSIKRLINRSYLPSRPNGVRQGFKLVQAVLPGTIAAGNVFVPREFLTDYNQTTDPEAYYNVRGIIHLAPGSFFTPDQLVLQFSIHGDAYTYLSPH